MAKPKKKLISKYVRVCVEGDTADGRQIAASDLQDIADTYDPHVYGARINVEHIRGVAPGGVFGSYGDVVAAKVEKVDIGGQKKLALFVQLAPTDALVNMVNNEQQKVYSSIEMAPNFAKTGKTYLVGLAVTDNPASLGTERLAFSCKHPEAKLYDHLKQKAGNLICAANEVSIAFDEVDDADDDSALGKFAALLTGTLERFTKAPEPVTPPPPPPNASQPDNSEIVTLLTAMGALLTEQSKEMVQLRRDSTSNKANLDALEERLANTPQGTQFTRPPVTGRPDNAAVTDC